MATSTLSASPVKPVPVDPSDPLIVRFPDPRGFNNALARLDALLAARENRPAALDWPEWTDQDLYHDGPEPAALDVEEDPPSDEDRAAWAAASGSEWERRQSCLHRTFAAGRLMGLAGCPL